MMESSGFKGLISKLTKLAKFPKLLNFLNSKV